MKRYLAFAGNTYYPCGGWGDFVGDFDTITEAFDAGKKGNERFGWWQVIDSHTKEEVYQTIEATL